jgi:hypothetical protein
MIDTFSDIAVILFCLVVVALQVVVLLNAYTGWHIEEELPRPDPPAEADAEGFGERCDLFLSGKLSKDKLNKE